MPSNNHKLNLVLDLDSTLIYCLQPKHMNLVDYYKKTFYTDSNYFGTLQSPLGFMFFRPKLKEFFDRATKKFNIYINSFGSEGYVRAICLKLFTEYKVPILGHWSIENRTELGRKTIGPLDPNYTYVIDDSPEVWSHYCIGIKPFIPYYENVTKKDDKNELEIIKVYDENDNSLLKTLDFIEETINKREQLLK